MTLETMEQKLEEMNREIERLRAIVEITNVMGRYQTLLVPQTMDRVAKETFAIWMDDVSMEVSDRGVYVGKDAVDLLFSHLMGPENEPQLEDGKADLRGAYYMHQMNTPMIEVAGDGKTAHAVWYSCGLETPFNKEKGKRQAKWCWGKYSVELIKGDCGWRIWHMHWFRGFMNDYYASWVDDFQNDTVDETDKSCLKGVLPTTYHRPYRPDKEVLPVPRNPKPYDTHIDSSWIYGEWLEK